MTSPTQGVHAQPWRSAVLDLIDECPGLTMEQDRWLSRRVKEMDFASAPAQPAAPQGGAYVENPAEIEHVAGDVSKNRSESNMTGGAYAELPEPDVRRLAIESGLIRKADSLRPTTWGRILRFAQAIQALRASHGQAPAGAAIARVVLGVDGKPASEVHLIAEGDELDVEVFDATYPQRAPHRIANLVEQPTAQPAPAGAALDVFGLQWPGEDRINLSTVFDTEAEALEYRDNLCDTPGILVVRLSAQPTHTAQPAPAAAPTPAAQLVGSDGRITDAVRSMIEGMSVSVDVSTGDHDAGHRYFGTVTEVMDDTSDKHGVTLLVQDAEPNFAPIPAAQGDALSPTQTVEITHEQIQRGLAAAFKHPRAAAPDAVFKAGVDFGVSVALLQTPRAPAAQGDALDRVTNFRHEAEGMVRGGEWVRLSDVRAALAQKEVPNGN